MRAIIRFLKGYCIAVLVMQPGVASANEDSGQLSRRLEGRSSVLTPSDAFTVKDSIEMVQPISLGLMGHDPHPRFASFSPDGKFFVAATSTGSVDRNSNRYVLNIYDVSKVMKEIKENNSIGAVASKKVISFETADFAYVYTGAHPWPIRGIKWYNQSRYLAFVAAIGNDRGDVYTYDTETGELVRRTFAAGSVQDYDISFESGTVIFTAGVIAQESCPIAFPEPEQIGTKTYIEHIGICTRPEWQEIFPFGRVRVFMTNFNSNGPGDPVSSEFTQVGFAPKIWVSPNGRWASVLFNNSRRPVPLEWKKHFAPGPGEFNFWRNVAGEDSKRRLVGHSYPIAPQFYLLDLSQKKEKPFFNAPVAYFGNYSMSHWLPDGRHVILTHTYLPFDNKSGHGGISDPTKLHFVLYDVITGHYKSFFHFDDGNIHPAVERVYTDTRTDAGARFIAEFRKNSKDGKVLDGAEGESGYALFHWDGTGFGLAGWREATHYPNGRPFDVRLVQDMNTPPDLYAFTEDRQSVRITDLNPAYRKKKLPPAQIYRWTSKGGDRWRGGLILPVGYKKGNRYPLVIQAHCFDENVFLRDGGEPQETAPFAARALSSAGFVVLQVDLRGEIQEGPTLQKDPSHGTQFSEGMDAVVDSLAKEGVIDEDKVGLIAWSGGGRAALSALVNSSVNFRAAILADAAMFGPVAYSLAAGYPMDVTSMIEEATEGYPWGDGLDNWIRNMPHYHLDRMRAALRIETYYRPTAIFSYDLFTLMKRQEQPVEFFVYDGASHAPRNPRQRLISSQSSVDWMKFWLLNEEDRDPKKSSQYSRWRGLREEARDASRTSNTVRLRGQVSTLQKGQKAEE